MLDILNVIAQRESTNWLTSMMKFELPNPDKIIKKNGGTVEVYRDLLADPHVYSCVQSRKSGILSMEWDLDDNGAGESIVQFVRDNLDYLNLNKIFNEMLDAPLFGYQPCEIMWQRRGTQLIVADVVGKPPEWFFFDKNNLLRFRHKDERRKGVAVPQFKFVTPTVNPRYNNPYGDAVLSKCYWPVELKKGAIRLWAAFLQMFGNGYLIGEYTEGMTSEKMLEALKSVRERARVAIPTGSKINVLNGSSDAKPELYQHFIHMLNADISKAILSQTLTTEQGDTGSYAMSQTHLQVRKDVVDADRKLIEESIDQLIYYLVRFNFGAGTSAPKFIMYEEDQADLNRSQRDSAIWGSGYVKPTMNYLTRYYYKEDECELIDKQASSMFAESDGEKLEKVSDPMFKRFVEENRKLVEFISEEIGKGKEFNAVERTLETLLPEMDTEEIEKILAASIMLSGIDGENAV